MPLWAGLQSLKAYGSAAAPDAVVAAAATDLQVQPTVADLSAHCTAKPLVRAKLTLVPGIGTARHKSITPRLID